MNSPNLNSTGKDYFEYRHKKFDQSSKRSGNASLDSSSGDYEHIKSDKISENSSTPNSTSHNFNWSTVKTSMKRAFSPDISESGYSDFLSLPEAKRPRSSSFSSYTTTFSPLPNIRHTSTPLMAISASAIPPPTAVLPKISDKTLHSICKYHGNMVRKFPKKERTPKDQERRNKNTLACRMSRRVKKLQYVAIEEQYKEFSQQTFKIIEQTLRSNAYLHELIKMSSCQQIQEEEEEIKVLPIQPSTPTSCQAKKSFTIAYLTGQEE